jgi:antitoxin CptB
LPEADPITMSDAPPTAPDEPLDVRRRRLKFRSWHRGTREMDLLMGSFADANLDRFGQDELDAYEVMLELSDPDLYNWFSGRESVPEIENGPVMRLFLAHRFA